MSGEMDDRTHDDATRFWLAARPQGGEVVAVIEADPDGTYAAAWWPRDRPPEDAWLSEGHATAAAAARALADHLAEAADG